MSARFLNLDRESEPRPLGSGERGNGRQKYTSRAPLPNGRGSDSGADFMIKFKALFIFVMVCSVNSYAEGTELNLYRPYAETTKHLPVTIASIQHGLCASQSKRIVREDAWNCVTDTGKIYDPCFSKRFGNNAEVICPESPWSGKGIQLTLQKPLDESHQVSLDMSTALPWAIELANGDQCLSIDSNQIYNNLPVHYQCASGVLLMGDAHRCEAVWTILRYDSQGITMMDVSKAWF